LTEESLKLSFHGADRGVTGSCHMIECAGKTILIDCGFYQGGRESEKANAEGFGFDPAATRSCSPTPISIIAAAFPFS